MGEFLLFLAPSALAAIVFMFARWRRRRRERALVGLLGLAAGALAQAEVTQWHANDPPRKDPPCSDES
jgi:hypothetical protein